MARIVTLATNPSLDMSTDVEHVVPEHKLRCSEPLWQAGGGGINVARVVKRLGGSPFAIYTCGGPQGSMLHAFLEDEGLNQKIIPIGDLTKESFAVRENASGQQYRFGVPGPTLAEAEWRACLAAVQDLDPIPNYLVLSGGLAPGVPEDFYRRLARWADQQGVHTILDTHHGALGQAVEAGVYLLKPNLRELRQLSGRKLESEEEQIGELKRIIERGGAEYIVLSLGAAGPYLQKARAPHVYAHRP